MAGYLSKMSKNVPPKARLVLGITAALGVGGVIFFANNFGSGAASDDPINNLAGGSKFTDAPSRDDIDKAKPGEERIIPVDSPVGQKVEEARQEEIDQKKKSGGGHIDQFIIDPSDAKDDSPSNPFEIEPVPDVSVDNAYNARNDITEERKRLSGRKDVDAKSQEAHAAHLREMAEIERAFLESELSQYSENKYVGYLASAPYKEADVSSSGYNSYAEGGSASQEQSKTGVKPSSTRETGGIVSRYTRSDYASNRVNPSDIDKFRSIGSGSSPKRSAPKQTAYEELVNPVQTVSKPAGEKINVGEMHYAILQIGINTDEIGPVRAYIPGDGKAGDAVLVGEPVRIGEKASIVFKNMTKDGVDYPINAIALDPDTLRPALADNVDRHIFERYFKIAIAAAADGYVNALTGSSTKTYSDGSTEEVYERLPDADDQIAAAVGRVGQVLIPKFERDFDRPPTVEVNSNRDIIIMFMSGVEVQ